MSEDGSEDTPPRPKRKIKKLVLMSSGSSSDSDESITPARTRRKRLRVLSDDGSESSGSSVVRVGIRRNRPLPKLRDSDGDSDTSGWATEQSDVLKPAPSASKPTSGFASDSSEGNSDKCSICLLRFTEQAVGTPQSCEHIFCLDCITEWSKNVNTCPVDRMTFDSIVVKSCAGGRVLRTETVKVVERRPSIELLVTEDLTACQLCGSTENEETMLLCDSCDNGFHMQCLTPPLTEVPLDQWLCPNCDDMLSDVDNLFSGISEVNADHGSRRTLRQSRGTRSRNHGVAAEPSTSAGARSDHLNSEDIPSTSRGSRISNSSSRSTAIRRATTGYRTNRKRPKRRRTKAVVIEYEVQENGKFPVIKQIKRKLKKRKTRRRQPRTAARRTHVRASVRAKLASMTVSGRLDSAQPSAGGGGVQAMRRRGGVPLLSLFGGARQLDYFSDDEHAVSEAASTAVAVRPTSSILSAYRQARRKMIRVPSPSYAASAPDVLSDILESQTLLHSKRSLVSVTVQGDVNIKLESRARTEKPKKEEKKDEKVDLSQGEDAAKKVPSYPGQSRGGGWGGGYRGSYRREQNSNNFNRGGNHENDYQGYHNRSGNQYQNNNNNMRRDDNNDTYNNYSRRPNIDDVNFDRNRRAAEQNRPNLPHNQRQEPGRYSATPSWQPYTPPPPGQPYTPPPRAPRPDAPAMQHRHSFGGFENPLDMRMGRITRQTSANTPMEAFPDVEASRPEKQRQSYHPLPEPPVFKFEKRDVEKSEDEKSDSGLVIDTEKYDPTEPTNDDDDSGDEDKDTSLPAPPPLPEVLPAFQPADTVQSILAGIDTSAMNVPADVLDSAVRQVLKEHRNLIVAPSVQSRNDKSDEDSDGDCPNFSIYSATSVHIANDTNDAAGLTAETPRELPEDNLEDLVQEDDETPVVTPESGSTPVPPETVEPEISYEKELKPEVPTHIKYSSVESIVSKLRKTDEELNEKISKRCPITTNVRNPIKIKLNTPSLIKRQVSLYDDEEEILEDIEERMESSPEPKHEKPSEKQSSEKETKISETIVEQQSESIQEANKPLYDEESIQEEVENIIKTDETPALSDNEDDSSTKAEDTKTDVDELKRDDRSEVEEDTDSERRGTSEKSAKDPQTDDENDDLSGTEDTEMRLDSASPGKSVDRNDDLVEKMTESISETEDERSYTPCLDENKSKDTSLETEKDKGIEGLDTEMISEDEGNEMFSDSERVASDARASPPARPAGGEEGEILEKKKETGAEEPKKKKKKDSKKEGKEKKKIKKGEKAEIAFKKLSKSGKERNYRERDKDKDKEGKNKRQRRESSEGASRHKQRRKERRKDLERYDVRSLVTDKRRRPKDPFGRDVSPGLARSRSRSRSHSPGPSPPRRSASRPRRSPSPPRASPPRPRRASSSPRRLEAAPSPRSASPPPPAPPRAARDRRRSAEREKRPEARRRRSAEKTRKRKRSASGSRSPRPRPAKKRKRARSSRSASRRRSPRRRSPRRRRAARRLAAPAASPPGSRPPSPRTPPPEPAAPPAAPPAPPAPPAAPRRRDPERPRRRRARDAPGPSKEVFTSGDNILVSVSFEERERGPGPARRERRRERRRRRAAAPAAGPAAGPGPGPAPPAPRPVAVIDLARSPCRELTPEPRDVIVLSDSEPGDAGPAPPPAAAAPAAASPAQPPPGPQTPPEPPAPPAAEGGAGAPPGPPESPDAYDPYEPTRSASASPAAARPASPPRTMMTLETAQKTNMSADDVIDRRPLSPIEKVMALLQSTRDVSPEPPPRESGGAGGPGGASSPPPAPAAAPQPAPAPPVRIVLPSPTRSQPPKLFLAKPSPIKSDPIKPMQMQTKLCRALPLPLPAALARRREDDAGGGGGASPYSPGSSDFGDLFEPPGGGGGVFDALLDRPQRGRKSRGGAAKVPVKLNKRKGKTQVGVKIAEDNLKILDDLPSSAVEMQVKSKFLKKLNRQERVVEEVKLVLKPHYNKKHVTKDEYKDILRRAVPKICHNKTGEINPAKIQSLVEAYVKKFRKKHKLGLA